MTRRWPAAIAWCVLGSVLGADARSQNPPPPPQSQVPPRPITPAAPPAPPHQDPDYHIGIQDVVRVDVMNYRDAFPAGDYQVFADGTVMLPLLGAFYVKGMTQKELQDNLRDKFKAGRYFTNANVSVTIASYHSQSFKIQGEVHTMGTFFLGADEMTLQRALQTAGGLTSNAGYRLTIRRKRSTPDAPASAGKATSDQFDEITVNYQDLIDGKIPDPKLEDQDQILVPKAKQIFVNGQVRSPGPQRWDPGLTVAQAIQNAGSWTDFASKSRVQVVRVVNGKQKKIGVNEKQQLTFILEADDVIDVPKRYM